MQLDEVVLERWIAKSELDRAEAAGEEFFRLVSQPLRRHQPEAARIVGGDAFRRAAEERRKWPTGGDRQRVPRCHVKSRHRHADDALNTHECEALGKLAPELDGREPLAL